MSIEAGVAATGRMTSLVQALALWQLRINVFPVPCPRAGVQPGHPGDGKVPEQPWKIWQSQRQTEADVVALFRDRTTNIAIITGAISDLVVVDLDGEAERRWAARRLPYTPRQTQTGRPGGFHLFYRHPGVLVRNRARIETGAGTLAIDVRGDGGYVIAPGSVHASGFVYRAAGDWTAPRVDVPKFWPGWLERPKRVNRNLLLPRTSQPSGDVITRARKYLAAIPQPVIGQGSDVAMLKAACRLRRGFNLSPTDTEALLWKWAGNRSGWTREWVARKVESADKYGTEPIAGLLA